MDHKLTIVRISGGLRCVYLNNTRIVGNKPYISEGGEYVDFKVSENSLLAALPRDWRDAITEMQSSEDQS